ncbi:hypothetical protein GKZ68_10250 [Hymenobacter sp. BRD128]|uniref:hypothetical protein n=1 Tax=Hymenobacter sp. BRD128 TaxID=2675878 RepID=UPI001566F6EA|nr:hypothetical protein [Hymenobacter sp. BRD128]QKG56971.1 hypothetical protein GKZ68_10250 [Hymenobacter sp. BRD128]
MLSKQKFSTQTGNCNINRHPVFISEYLLTKYITLHKKRSIMETIIKYLAHHWHLSAAQYWQLRLLVAISLVPFLAFVYIMLIDKRTRFFESLRRAGRSNPRPTRLFTSS